jgi:hypothetical protein
MATRNTGIRDKSAKKRRETEPAKKKQEPLKRGVRIRVENLRRGDRIVTSWHTKGEAARKGGRQLTEDEIFDVMVTGEERFVNRSVEVKDFDECPGQWRTHVHVNKNQCYDIRQYVWIVAE